MNRQEKLEELALMFEGDIGFTQRCLNANGRQATRKETISYRKLPTIGVVHEWIKILRDEEHPPEPGEEQEDE